MLNFELLQTRIQRKHNSLVSVEFQLYLGRLTGIFLLLLLGLFAEIAFGKGLQCSRGMSVLLVEPVLVGVSLGIARLQLLGRLSWLGNQHNRLNFWVGVEETQLAQVAAEQEGTGDL